MKRIVSAPQPEIAPPPQWEEFERLAREALALLSAGEAPDCAALREQLLCVSFERLDYSGAGFFLTLSAEHCATRLGRDGMIIDVMAEAVGVDAPLGVNLFVKNGRAEMLEVFGHGDWPSDLSPYGCRYIAWRSLQPNGHRAENVDARDVGSMWGS